MKKMLLPLLFFITISLTAQIDTTDWYPLHIGDKWEYYGQGLGYSQVEVVGDTLMSNGETYFIIVNVNLKYQRIDSNRYVMVYNEYADNNEFINFDLHANKGDILFTLEESNYGYGVYETGRDNDNLINLNLAWKEYRETYLDTSVTPPDTIWNETVDAYWPRITKGLGVTSYAYDLTTLVGANINGIGYGTLVGIKDPPKIPSNNELYQNYPNPFNPSTTIKYSIYKNGFVKLKVYDMLGNEVATLVNEIKAEGNYNIVFNASSLISGIYFYRLQSGNFSKTKKLLLVK